MLATLTDAVLPPDWLFEPKLDGYRVLAFIDDGEVSCTRGAGSTRRRRTRSSMRSASSRPARWCSTARSWRSTRRACRRSSAAAAHRPRRSRQIFSAWRSRSRSSTTLRPAVPRRLRPARCPLESAKTLLTQRLLPTDRVRPVRRLRRGRRGRCTRRRRRRLEGVVAKRRDSKYEAGQALQGLAEGQGHPRATSSSSAASRRRRGPRAHLRLAARRLVRRRGAKLIYAGNVGTGFDDSTLAKLLRAPRGARRRTKSPFDGYAAAACASAADEGAADAG